MIEVKSEDYHVWYEPKSTSIYCQGSLRLAGTEEYAPIVDILESVLNQTTTHINLNLCQLEFLNSSGINVLSKFVIKVRQKDGMQITVQGAEDIPWQRKSLKNLQRLMPSLKLEWL
jgi:hypothetical protein